jgi:hypothetical protein
LPHLVIFERELFIGRAIDHRQAITDFVGRHRDLHKYDLTALDWDSIILVTGWLKSFRTATTLMSTTKRPMLSYTHAIFRGLQEDLRTSLRELPLSTPSVLRNGLLDAHRKLSDYYYKLDQSPYYTWAARECCHSWHTSTDSFDAVLDPRISHDGLKADFYHDTDLLEHLEQAKTSLSEHFHENYANKARRVAPVPITAPSHSTNQSASPQKDFTARYRVQRRSVADELRDYFNLPREDFLLCDPVQWWVARKAQFPNLFGLARDLMTIPGLSVASAST